jgi:hypothetical protein
MAVLLHGTSRIDQRRAEAPELTPPPGARLVPPSARPARRGAARPRPAVAGRRLRVVRVAPGSVPGGDGRFCRTRPAGHQVLTLVGIAALTCLVVVGLGLLGALSGQHAGVPEPPASVSASISP